MVIDRGAAFLALLEPVYDRLSRFALAMTRNDQDAEDLVSETVLIAFERFHELREQERLLPFLLSIASRLHKRRRYRERHRVPYEAGYAENQRDTTPLPDRQAELRIIQDALDKLPTRMRETVILFDVSDLSLEEIREIQGGTLSGVKTRLKRGRERLSRMLGGAQSSPKHVGDRRDATARAATEVLFVREQYGR